LFFPVASALKIDEGFNLKTFSIYDMNLPLSPFAYITKAKTAAFRILLEYEKAFQSQFTLAQGNE